MAERQGFVRVPSDEVQGPGSYVVVRKLSHGQRKKATRMIARANGGQLPNDPSELANAKVDTEYLDDNDTFTAELLAANVAEWNWVDFDGKALPLPKEDAGLVDRLTDEEVEFLARAINAKPSKEEQKN